MILLLLVLSVFMQSRAFIETLIGFRGCPHIHIPRRLVNVKRRALNRKTVDLMDYDGVRRKVAFVELGNGRGSSPEKELIILGGCAQNAESFMSHFPVLERVLQDWRIIVPEFRCQQNTFLLTKNSTIETLCSDLESLIQELNLNRPNLLGFSFGGRVALAFTASRPHLVGPKISLTGVSAVRGGLGDLIIEGWRDSLQKGDLDGIAWSFVINGYSREYLEKHSIDWLKAHVRSIADSVDAEKLLDLITYSHRDDDSDTQFGVRQSAARLAHKKIQIITAEEDRIACANGAAKLHEELRDQNECQFVQLQGGHLAPFENPRTWRNLILEFMKD